MILMGNCCRSGDSRQDLFHPSPSSLANAQDPQPQVSAPAPRALEESSSDAQHRVPSIILQEGVYRLPLTVCPRTGRSHFAPAAWQESPPFPDPPRQAAVLKVKGNRTRPGKSRISEAGPPITPGSQHVWLKSGRRYAVTEATRRSQLLRPEGRPQSKLTGVPSWAPQRTKSQRPPEELEPTTGVAFQLDQPNNDSKKEHRGVVSLARLQQAPCRRVLGPPLLTAYPEAPQALVTVTQAVAPPRDSSSSLTHSGDCIEAGTQSTEKASAAPAPFPPPTNLSSSPSLSSSLDSSSSSSSSGSDDSGETKSIL